jgi:hypothetical protein
MYRTGSLVNWNSLERLPVFLFGWDCGQGWPYRLKRRLLQEDIRKAKELGADHYRVKPVGIESIVKILQDLHACWLNGTQQFRPHDLRCRPWKTLKH